MATPVIPTETTQAALATPAKEQTTSALRDPDTESATSKDMPSAREDKPTMPSSTAAPPMSRGATGDSSLSTPGNEVPGAFPRHSPATDEGAGSSLSDTISQSVQSAAQYLPKSVSAYLPASAATATGGTIRASSHDVSHQASLPSTELTGTAPGEHVGGVGSLPGNISEVSVSKLPDERSVIDRFGVTSSGTGTPYSRSGTPRAAEQQSVVGDARKASQEPSGIQPEPSTEGLTTDKPLTPTQSQPPTQQLESEQPPTATTPTQSQKDEGGLSKGSTLAAGTGLGLGAAAVGLGAGSAGGKARRASEGGTGVRMKGVGGQERAKSQSRISGVGEVVAGTSPTIAPEGGMSQPPILTESPLASTTSPAAATTTSPTDTTKTTAESQQAKEPEHKGEKSGTEAVVAAGVGAGAAKAASQSQSQSSAVPTSQTEVTSQTPGQDKGAEKGGASAMPGMGEKETQGVEKKMEGEAGGAAAVKGGHELRHGKAPHDEGHHHDVHVDPDEANGVRISTHPLSIPTPSSPTPTQTKTHTQTQHHHIQVQPGNSDEHLDEYGELQMKAGEVTLRPREKALGSSGARWGGVGVGFGSGYTEGLGVDLDEDDGGGRGGDHHHGPGYDTTYHPAQLHPMGAVHKTSSFGPEGEQEARVPPSEKGHEAKIQRDKEQQQQAHDTATTTSGSVGGAGTGTGTGAAAKGGEKAKKVGFMEKMKGEAKVLLGKVEGKKGEGKVEEGRRILRGEGHAGAHPAPVPAHAPAPAPAVTTTTTTDTDTGEAGRD